MPKKRRKTRSKPENKKVEMNCQGADTLPLDDVLEFQGDLKTLPDENADKLRDRILELGFCEPLAIWQDDEDNNNILNGHQRVKVLHWLRDKDDYTVPEVPVVYVDAPTKKQAKRIVLSLTSQFGRITPKGLSNFATDAEIDPNNLDEEFEFQEMDWLNFTERDFGDGENAANFAGEDFADVAEEFKDRHGESKEKDYWMWVDVSNEECFDALQEHLGRDDKTDQCRELDEEKVFAALDVEPPTELVSAEEEDDKRSPRKRK